MSSNREKAPSNNSSKSVRFSAETTAAAERTTRKRRGAPTDDDIDDDDDGVIENYSVSNKKKKYRPNEDEMDDIDDWNEEEDGNPEDTNDGLPSVRDRENAKRARRRNRENGTTENGDDDDDQVGIESTNIDERTSLASEGITIEPFHMKQEQSDGTGFFDGDTYVFRKRQADEEPDAWLESLKDSGTPDFDGKKTSTTYSEDGSDPESEPKDSLTKEEWYAKIVNLVSDTETIMQAVIRYGALIKRQPLKRTTKARKHDAVKSNSTASEENPQASEAFQFAAESLNSLTEAANALLGLGDVDIYEKTRNDLLKLIPSTAAEEEEKKAATLTKTSAIHSKEAVSWEYKGSQDGQIHGPYTSEQMKTWTQAGYFVGAQAVQIRSVKEEEEEEKDLGQDLLSDLMDDDEEGENKPGGGCKEKKRIVGEWVSSNSVDFASFC